MPTMPTTPRPRRQPTDGWDQLRLLVSSPEQETYELLRLQEVADPHFFPTGHVSPPPFLAPLADTA